MKRMKLVKCFSEIILFILACITIFILGYIGTHVFIADMEYYGRILIPLICTLAFGIIEIMKSIFAKRMKIKILVVLILQFFALNFFVLNIRNLEYMIASPLRIILWIIYILFMFKILENYYINSLIETSDNKKEQKKQLRKDKKSDRILIGIKTLLLCIVYIVVIKSTFDISIVKNLVADLDNDGIDENIEVIEEMERAWDVVFDRMMGLQDGPPDYVATYKIKVNNRIKYKRRFSLSLHSFNIEDYDNDGVKEITAYENYWWGAHLPRQNVIFLFKYNNNAIELEVLYMSAEPSDIFQAFQTNFD